LKMTLTSEGTLIKVIVKPKSKNFKVISEEENLLVFCRSVPEQGKVNRELIKELSRLLKREVMMVSGFTSKEKVILVKDTTLEELGRLLPNLLHS
jgi:uncharacterized protein (TIGR00251 family)